MKHVQRKMKRKKKRKEMYLKLRFIKQNGADDWCILFMLRLKRKKRTRDNVKEKSQHTCQDKLQESQKYIKDKVELEVTYSSLSSKCRVRGCLSLTASCSAGRGSICRWPWSSRFGLAYELKLGKTLLTRHRNIPHELHTVRGRQCIIVENL